MLMASFIRDRSGNFGIMTALLMVPLIATAGLAIDLGNALEQRQVLMNAADAAAVGALAEKSAGVAEALTMSTDGTVSMGNTDAEKLFAAQLPSDLAGRLGQVDIDIQRKGNELYSQLSFSATVPTMFLSVLGKDSFTVTGSATATYQTNAFIDFYMLLDNTPSMGLAATKAGIELMEKEAKCAFACHTTEKASENTYLTAKNLGVAMRIDVVREATQALTHDATEYARVANQYRMAVYTFGASADSVGLTEVAAMNDDMAAVRSATDAVDLMTTKQNNYKNNELTDFNSALTSMKDEIGSGGTGFSMSDRQKVLFFVADGVADYKNAKCTERLTGTRCQEPLNPAYCTAIKQKGVKIAVLYATYLELPKNNWWVDWIKPFTPKISANMQSCASPGYFFEVSPSHGITEAMQTLFRKVINAPRLTG